MLEVCPLAPVAGDMLDGRFKIVREIGHGSLGAVYEAIDGTSGNHVAVRTLLEAVSADAELAARFRREARAAGAIDNPHIVQLIAMGRTSQGLLYMVTELFNGYSLAQLLRRAPRLPIPLAVHLISQVLDGLLAAHEQGLIHRGLEPEGILITDGAGGPNFAAIVDFGVAKIVRPQGGKPAGGAVPSAGTGWVQGATLYMSPELIAGRAASIDHRTDLYSAGAILYEMLCGHTPIEGNDVAQVLQGIQAGRFPSPRSLRPEISPFLEVAIARALSRDPFMRFSSAADMRAAISGASVGAAPPSSPRSAAPPSLPTTSAGRGEQHEPFALEQDTVVDAPLVGPGKNASLDPFMPSPASGIPPALAREGFEPAAGRSTFAQDLPAEAAPLRLGMSSRARAQARDKGASMAPSARRRRGLPWLALVGGAVVLAVAGLVAVKVRRPQPVALSSAPPEEIQKFRLHVYPAAAKVEIDHVPVSARELPLDSGAPRAHLLHVAARGHVTRTFTFTATAGMNLEVRLGRTIPVPTPEDPPPLPTELAVDYPEDPRPAAEIDSAFASLDRYSSCLAGAAKVIAEARTSGEREYVRGEHFAPCRRLVEESQGADKGFPSLKNTALAFVLAAQAGKKAETLNRFAARFRAEFLAERAFWQMQELARTGKDDGQGAAWHMRRVALAARTWVRARRSGANGGRAGDEQGAKVDAYVQALVRFVREGKQALGIVRGTDDFLRVAQELAALARPQGERRVSDAAAYEACRKILTEFDALVLE